MTPDTTTTDHKDDTPPGISEVTFHRLERVDDYVNLAIVGLFIVLAVSIIVYTCVVFAQSLPSTLGSVMGRHGGTIQPGAEDPFIQQCLDFLSNTLFAVIVLELLQSILTYVRSHSAQAVVRDFLVVAMISTVRKILLTGAHSSLKAQTSGEYLHESLGTLMNVGAILLLVGGLTLWQRMGGQKKG